MSDLPSRLSLARSLAEHMISGAIQVGLVPEGFTFPPIAIIKTQALLVRDKITRTRSLEALAGSHGYVFKHYLKNDHQVTVNNPLPKTKTFLFHFEKLVANLADGDLVILQSLQPDRYFLYNKITGKFMGKCRKELMFYLACDNRLMEVGVTINNQKRIAFTLAPVGKVNKPSFNWDFQKVPDVQPEPVLIHG